MNGTKHFDKNILGNIFGILGVVHQPEAGAYNQLLVFFNQLPESFLVSFLKFFYDFGLAHSKI
jgi:hypothetical protein